MRPPLPAVALLLIVGCQPASSVPQFDYSHSDAYQTAEFKDDAAANRHIAAGEFPSAFLDLEGKTVDLARFRGEKKVVLVVVRGVPRQYKGAFCPSCLAQVSSLMANRDEFVKRKAEVLVLFPGPHERLEEFLGKVRSLTPGEPEWSFRMLIDRECSACDQLGIRDDLARPSTFILDLRGNVVFAYVGETSTDRPSIKAILAQLDGTP